MPSWSREGPTAGGGGASPAPAPHADYTYLPPPHRLSSFDDPYHPTVSAAASPRASVASFAPSPSPSAGSYVRVEHDDAMPLSTGQHSGYANMETPYSNQEYSSSRWLEKEQARNKRSKWIVIGSLIGLVVIIAAGVAAGVTLSKKKSSSSSGSQSSSASSVTNSDPNDPSKFDKDDRLIKSFWGIAYTPENSLYPACGNSLENIITDIQLMSQLTDQIRLYGADCNQSALVLEAIKQTKVNMTVWLGNYPEPTDPAPYLRQRDAIIDAIKTYGTDHISGITVGNEFILNYLNANGGTSPNDPVGQAGAALLITNITDTRNAVAALDLSKKLPIGTADAGSYFNTQVLEAVDYGMANIHAWFANVSIAQAAGWVNEFFQDTDVAAAQNLTNKPTMYIAETGWPTASKDISNESNGPSIASEPNLQTFLNTFVCQANANGTGYFFFEYFDETWKDQEFGGVEGHWGLFYSNRTLKDITIPKC